MAVRLTVMHALGQANTHKYTLRVQQQYTLISVQLPHSSATNITVFSFACNHWQRAGKCRPFPGRIHLIDVQLTLRQNIRAVFASKRESQRRPTAVKNL